VNDFLTHLATLNINLKLEGERLTVNAPPGVLTPALREQLRARKEELLALLHAQTALRPIPRRATAETGRQEDKKTGSKGGSLSLPVSQSLNIPLSYAQQRLWFLAQLESSGGTYHLATLLHLRGQLVIDALQQSLTALVARHEILRTTYAVVEGVPCQQIGAPQPVALTQVDLTATPLEQQLPQVQERIQQEQARGFDLAHGPLWRFVLFHLAADSTMLAIVMHHLITDEWSTGVLVREVSALYRGFVTGQPADLPPLPIQYADYAIWQREQLSTPRQQQQLAAWCQQLRDAPTTLPLPNDLRTDSHPVQQAHVEPHASAVTFTLDAHLTARLKSLAQSAGTTLYTTLLAAFALLLARYSQQDDLVIGSPVANRERSELEPLIGFFVNTVPLRITLNGNPTFQSLLGAVRQRVLDGFAHAHIPLEQVVETLQPDRRLHHNPLFQSMFVWQNGVAETLDLPDLTVERLPLPITDLPVDLLLALSEEDDTLLGWWRYNTARFSAALMQQMVTHFQQLLSHLVQQPTAPLDTLPLLTPAEQQQVLVEWNGSPDATLQPACLHHLFEAQVARTPDAVAVIVANELGNDESRITNYELRNTQHATHQLTYDELNQRANHLAHALLAEGIGVGSRVAICMERAPTMLVAILAVLKSGAAYVPIDPDYPTERLAYLLADAQVALLLTQQHLVARLPKAGPPQILVDQPSEQTGDAALPPSPNPISPVTPTDPIYLIYTSGSTGQPKGVVVTHAGVANTVRAIAQRVALGPADRLLQFVPFSFDASALEFFATLTVGAALVLHPNPTRLAADELFALCCQAEVTVVNFTVALWQQWVENLVRQGLRFPPHLRVFLVGGDKPAVQTLRTWATLGDHPMIFLCSYGPTEAAITTTIYVTTNAVVRRAPPTTITLGQPLPNTAIYILDAHHQLTPIGVTGELYIGGVGVARGYWQRPALTRERFLYGVKSVRRPSPSSPLLGEGTERELRDQLLPPLTGEGWGGVNGPLYRTGDLARWLPNGECKFVGRVDTQVKIRGFRIELGEIESHLRALSLVCEAVVLAVDVDGDKRLVAYVQPSVPTVTQSELAAALQERVPAHLLPTAWVLMSAWPLTPNGKIDRAALPRPTFQDNSADFIPPATPVEAAVAAIWQAVLGIDTISVESNFFALGGHSLLATQVVARLQQQMGKPVALRTLFEKPTIRELAAAINAQADTTTANATASERPPLLPIARIAIVDGETGKHNASPSLSISQSPNLPISSYAPLSFAQQRLWLIQQLEPQSVAYNIPGALRLRGRLDVTALQGALDGVIARHESLRTRFVMAEGEPVQMISPPQPLSLTLVDLGQLPPAEREAAAQAHAQRLMQTPFDLAQGPLLRAVLYQLAADDVILFVLLHHIITDGWSIPLLLDEVAERYAAHREGRPAGFPPLPIHYADYAHWQRQWLQGAILQEQLAYWRDHLAGAPPLLTLPTSYPRPARPTYGAATLTFTVATTVVQPLQAFAQAHGATLYMTVLSAFALLLGRYSGQADLVIGSPIANRTHPALEELIGFFVNTLALRIDLGGQPTFVDLLAHVRQTTLAAYAHQDAPFEQVIDALALPRNESHAPLFQLLLAWQNGDANRAARALPDLDLQPVAWQKPTLDYDLALSISAEAGTLAVTWQYATDLFDAPLMTQMATHFQHLLATIPAQPTTPIAMLPLMSADDMARLLVAGHGPTQPELEAICLHHCFEAQAHNSPTTPAIFYEDTVISYGALNAQANQLAHHLVALGHGPGERLAVCVERSPLLPVTLLAVLKSGAAYLPLDPDYPTERLAYLLADGGVTRLLTQSQLADRLPATALPITWVDQLDLSAQPTSNPMTAVTLDDPFYQIYTSGSTGQPKGVVVPHRGVANTIRALAHKIGLEPSDRLFAFVPLGFDAAAIDLFAPLSGGAAVVLHPTPTRLSATELLAAYRHYGVTVAHLITAPWQTLVHNLAHQGERFPTHLRVCLTGGEKPAAQTLRTWADLADHEMLFVSSYGPSEASIIASTYITTNHAVRSAPPTVIDLGEPLPNVALYLLDEAGCPVPDGVTGELYIGGSSVAQGYWQRPALTAERFLPPPSLPQTGGGTEALLTSGRLPPQAGEGWGGVGSGLLYRTGDLARRRLDGSYEFIGRADNQVKIRGFRIELGEVEEQIKGLPGVHEAVVVAVAGSEGDKRLVAYVQPVTETTTAHTLAEALKQRAPAHLLPAAWVLLTEWPLTPNGKIDRQRLPTPTFAPTAETYVAPRTPLEATLATIWQTVLGRETVSVTSNFFELGGHSLSATQVVARIQQTLGLAVALRTLFDQPTIAELATVLSAQPTTAQPADKRPPLSKVARTDALPLSFGQQRLWLMQQLNPTSGFFNMPLAVWLEGTLQLEAIQAAFQHLIDRHEILRTTFPLVDGAPVQRIDPAGRLAFCYSNDTEQAIMAWVIAEAERPFDLQAGPLLRVALRQVTPTRHLLLVTMHHIIGDDWSRRLLMQEFAALYRAYVADETPTLLPLPIQYADFAQWQRAWLQGPLLQTQLDYWRSQLADAPPLIELPTDYPRPPQQRFVGDRLVVTLAGDLAKRLHAFSRQQQSTLHMTLLAGFAALLARYSGTTDLVIGIPVAGRTDPQLEPLLGFFLNTLALRLRLADDATFAALVAQVKAVTLDAYAHQDAPFEAVIEAVKPTPQLSHTPIFQVMFDLLQADRDPFDLPGITTQPVDFSTHNAKFDLNLVFGATGQAEDAPLVATWEYNSDLFARATIEQMAQQLHHLLQAALTTPTRPLSRLPLVSAAERNRLLTAWNQPGAALPDPFCMQQHFERQAAQTPDRIAVADGTEHLTYRQLNERANGWARALVTQGVTADVIVALYWTRDIDFLTAILAIFKAGGAYLPLDPQTPPARLGQILAQSRTPLLLTKANFLVVAQTALATMTDEAAPTLLLVETLAQASAESNNLSPRNRPADLAYVIYTSGSTGTPKGVMVEQRGLVNHLLAMQTNLGLTAADHIGQTATQSYVISVWQWLAALVVGGRVQIVADEQVRDPHALLAAIEAHGISVVQVVPSLLRLLVAALQQRRAAGGEDSQTPLLPTVRWMIPTGEALPPALARAWLTLCPQIPLLNAYGSSECADDVTHDLITAPPEEGVVAMPIGLPIPNVQIYVLDEHLEPTALGAPGELYVGGAGVGRGYLYDPERTAQRFLHNPFDDDPTARLYKSGDRVRRLRNGAVEYLGRTDFQVKVRGIRVELGEIEAVLSVHPAVAQAVVVTGDEPTGGKGLVAYVVLQADADVTPQMLRAFLAERLPPYMVPPVIVPLDQFPLTSSGKVARTRLPVADHLRVAVGAAATNGDYLAPRNAVEETLVTILSDVLGAPAASIGVQQNFFDLGTHSMQAIQLVWSLRDRLGVELPLRSIFEETTVERLANLVIDAQLAQLDEATVSELFAEVEMGM
jgi:amino acid adenylation domain-containing protein